MLTKHHEEFIEARPMSLRGNTSGITDGNFIASAIYEYSDFGEVTEISETIDNEICYTGAIHDEPTGLHYMNARYYDPTNGRFISQDSYRGSVNDPGQWHLYVYCANNPINYTDPSGHSAWSVLLGVASEVLFFATQIASTPIKQKVQTLFSIWQAGVSIYDYIVAESKVRKKYKIRSKEYRQLMKFNNFMLGVSAVAITMDFLLWRLGKTLKIKLFISQLKLTMSLELQGVLVGSV